MSQGEAETANHPLAWRALLMAFMLQATSVACLYAPFSILLTAVEARTGAGRDVSSLGMLLVSLSSACLAPLAGYLAGRLPLRLLAAAGALLCSSGYALMALVPSIQAYLLAYGLLVGPGMALSGIVVPSVLVTRWFRAGRGRALGILHMPLLALVSPIAVNWLLRTHGAAAAYLLLAGTMAANLLLLPLLLDRPPGASSLADKGIIANEADTGRGGLKRVATTPAFWALSLATTAVLTSAAAINTHLFAMVTQWGISDLHAATLPSFGALAGAAGAYIFGWLADRLGGPVALALCCFDTALLCLALFLQPDYPMLIVFISLFGVHVAGAVPAFTLALSKISGPDAFGAAFGLGSFVFMVLSPFMTPISGAIFVRTGSYSLALIILIVLALMGAALALLGRAGTHRAAFAGWQRGKSQM
jgi:MFS family permease